MVMQLRRNSYWCLSRQRHHAPAAHAITSLLNPGNLGSSDVLASLNTDVNVIVDVTVQEGDPQKVSHASWKAHCLMTRNLLFDLELLAHADYFVGTTKSGLTPIIEVQQWTPFHL